MNELTAEERRRIDVQWKSDVDKKLDKLVKFMEMMVTRERLLTNSVTELNEVLNAGKGAMAMLFLIAKLSAAVGVIWGALYAVKKWLIE